MKYRAVIFDMDGVIVNSELAYYDQLLKFFNELSQPFSWQDYVPLIGMNHEDSWKILRDKAKSELTPEEFFQAHQLYCEEHPVNYKSILNPDFHRTYNFIKEKGLKVALASSSKLSVIQDMIDQNNLKNYFDVIYSGEMVKESKPHPDIYLKTAKELGVNPEDCLVMEDSAFGVTAAKAANMTALGLRNLSYSVDLSHSDDVVDKMSYLMDWIK